MEDKSVDMKKAERALKGDSGNSSDDLSKSLSQLLEHMTEDEAIFLLSDLSLFEIQKLVALYTVYEDNPVMRDFVINYVSLKVSNKRRGRKELVKIADAFSGVFETQNIGLKDKISGLVR